MTHTNTFIEVWLNYKIIIEIFIFKGTQGPVTFYSNCIPVGFSPSFYKSKANFFIQYNKDEQNVFCISQKLYLLCLLFLIFFLGSFTFYCILFNSKTWVKRWMIHKMNGLTDRLKFFRWNMLILEFAKGWQYLPSNWETSKGRTWKTFFGIIFSEMI